MSQKKMENEQEKVEKNETNEEINENENIDMDEKEQAQPTQQDETEKDKKSEECREWMERFQRLAAEFDNYKKRTLKEKEKLYCSAVADVVSAFLPVVDNVERALSASDGSGENIREGVQLIYRQIQDVLSNLDVKHIEALGKPFNPDYHEAVMHIEDDSYGENEIIEEFCKGYIYKNETVIRHSVVKVAN